MSQLTYVIFLTFLTLSKGVGLEGTKAPQPHPSTVPEKLITY